MRARIVCSASAESVPCSPSNNRPWMVDGSSRPSPSAMRHPWDPQRATSGYQSEQCRDRRVTS